MHRVSRRRAIALALILCFTAREPWAAELTVFKASRLLVYREGATTRTFRIALGSAPVGRKTREGDRRTPEGDYFVTHKNPHSQYTLSLGVSYPNLADADLGFRDHRISAGQFASIKTALEAGRQPPQNTPLGGEVFIHGKGAARDWTWGCIALDDPDMVYLFARVRPGDRLRIRP